MNQEGPRTTNSLDPSREHKTGVGQGWAAREAGSLFPLRLFGYEGAYTSLELSPSDISSLLHEVCSR